jgi:ABC-type multidrug transport system fused ATPase/permease subunit
MRVISSLRQGVLVRLWAHIPSSRKRQLIGLNCLMILCSFLELVSLGSIVPLLSSLVSTNFSTTSVINYQWLNFSHFSNREDAVIFYSLIFGVFSLISGASKLIVIWLVTRLSFTLGAEFGISIYERTLHQPYLLHISRNSSEVISGVQDKSSNLVGAGILPILNLCSALPMAIMILFFLINTDPWFAISMFVGIGFIYISIISFTYKRLAFSSKEVSEESVNIIKIMQEGLSGIREIVISGAHDLYTDSFKKSYTKYQCALANIQVICNLPRQGTEALAMVFISLVVCIAVSRNGELESMVPILGLFAYGSQKLLPLFQQIYSSITTINGARESINDALDLLEVSQRDYGVTDDLGPMTFHSTIYLNNLSFKFQNNSPLILKNIDLEIFKGERVGVVGQTGAGKSTLLDILMGLVHPTNGRLLIDGMEVSEENAKSWRYHIAQVPQSIYFTDGSIAENIAFGVDKNKIDINKVVAAAEKAQIFKTINSLPHGFDTNIGERGIKLSGGQRQRLGIARALYRDADVLVFDEATSALDVSTEDLVMSAIDVLSKELTIIVVTHRINTLKNMDRIIEISNGCVSKITINT